MDICLIGSYGKPADESLMRYAVDFEEKTFRKRGAVSGLSDPDWTKSTGSREPRDLAHFGDYLLIGHQGAGKVTAMHFHRGEARLSRINMELELPVKPVCIVKADAAMND